MHGLGSAAAFGTFVGDYLPWWKIGVHSNGRCLQCFKYLVAKPLHIAVLSKCITYSISFKSTMFVQLHVIKIANLSKNLTKLPNTHAVSKLSKLKCLFILITPASVSHPSRNSRDFLLGFLYHGYVKNKYLIPSKHTGVFLSRFVFRESHVLRKSTCRILCLEKYVACKQTRCSRPNFSQLYRLKIRWYKTLCTS